MRLIFWHNPACSKSRAALALLHERDLQPQVVLYLKTPPDAATLRATLDKLGFASARELMRTGEAIYQQRGLAETTLSEAQLITAMIEQPGLIERPVLINGDRACIGRPPEQVLTIL